MSRFEVWAKPRARKSAVVHASAERLEIALAAPPVEGAANDELVRFLASALGVRQRDVVLVRGASGRHKLVEFPTLDEAEVLSRLAT